jgi:hypothetical protein
MSKNLVEIVVLLFHGNNHRRKRLSVTLYVHCVSCLGTGFKSRTWILLLKQQIA